MNDIRKYVELIRSMEISESSANIDTIKRKVVSNFPLVLPTVMYHATKESNIESIRKVGLLPDYYGTVHGTMGYKQSSLITNS